MDFPEPGCDKTVILDALNSLSALRQKEGRKNFWAACFLLQLRDEWGDAVDLDVQYQIAARLSELGSFINPPYSPEGLIGALLNAPKIDLEKLLSLDDNDFVNVLSVAEDQLVCSLTGNGFTEPDIVPYSEDAFFLYQSIFKNGKNVPPKDAN